MTELTDEQIKLAAAVGAQAYRESHKRAIKSDYEKKKRNTKLILTNYHYLEDHVEVGLPKLTDEDFEYASVLPADQLSIYSLLGYHARSKAMILFIDAVLGQYKKDCQKSTDERLHRRYPVIECVYLLKPMMTREATAERFNVNRKTIDRDIQQAMHDLSVMMWGADAIDDLSR
ncbi:hypothetical protein [Lactiplantibacillus paraxiangfangensis]|uniref:hypothetical protein n=1 Tax=Lactiplantibacillus paraxiangfangensis TaxID=3076224 RepID=UPI0030C704C0